MSTVKAAKSAVKTVQAPVINKEILDVYTQTLNILGSKLNISSKIGQPAIVSIIGNGNLFEGSFIYNTNVTTDEKLDRAIEMLNEEDFFSQATTVEEAKDLRNLALNASQVSFSTRVGRGDRLSNGDIVKCMIEEYTSKAGNQGIGLKFLAVQQATAPARVQHAGLDKLKAFASAANDPFED